MGLEKPAVVRIAQERHNHEALSALGKEGARQAALARSALMARRDEELARLIEAQGKIAYLSNEGDVLPPGDNPTFH